MPVPLFDAHCDTASEIYKKNLRLYENALQCDMRRGSRFVPYAQVYAVWTDAGQDGFVDLSKKMLKNLLSELSANSERTLLCKSAVDLRAAAGSGLSAALISVEGAEQLGCDLDQLKSAYALGVRIVNPVWNYDNALCGAALGENCGGLTALGADFVKAAQALGVAIDLSHASEAAFWGILAAASRPVFASHSNSFSICRHKRNLTDGQFRALAESGGAVGVNMVSDFLAEDGDADIYDVFRHIERFLSLGGEKAVCLGGDLDGTDKLPRDFAGIQDYDRLYELLLRENLNETLARDIFYNNLLNAFDKML